jgi:hypothetical protein
LLISTILDYIKENDETSQGAACFRQLVPVLQESVLAYETGLKVGLADRTPQVAGDLRRHPEFPILGRDDDLASLLPDEAIEELNGLLAIWPRYPHVSRAAGREQRARIQCSSVTQSADAGSRG